MHYSQGLGAHDPVFGLTMLGVLLQPQLQVFGLANAEKEANRIKIDRIFIHPPVVCIL
jgi:hypothetical protein